MRLCRVDCPLDGAFNTKVTELHKVIFQIPCGLPGDFRPKNLEQLRSTPDLQGFSCRFPGTVQDMKEVVTREQIAQLNIFLNLPLQVLQMYQTALRIKNQYLTEVFALNGDRSAGRVWENVKSKGFYSIGLDKFGIVEAPVI